MTTTDHATIEEQAKSIMDGFLEELATIGEEQRFGLERERQMREPKATPPDEAFRRAFFANAPDVRDGLLIAERKKW